jgi:hypothetical protein
MSVKIDIGNKLPTSTVGKINWHKDMIAHNKKIDESRANNSKSVAKSAGREIIKMSRKGGQIIASSCCFNGDEYERIFGHK